MQSLRLTIARNSLFMIGSQIALKCLSIIFSIVIVRKLGGHDFGIYSTVSALVGITAVFSDMGIAGYAVRKIAEDRSNAPALLPNIISLRLLLALLLLVVNICLAMLLGYSRELVGLIALGSIGLLLYACQGPLEVVLLGFERFDIAATFTVVNQVVFIAAGGALLWLGWGIRGVLIASFCGIIATGFAAWRAVRRLIVWSWQIDVRSWVPLLRAGIPFCLSTFAMTVSFKVDTILLSLWRTAAEVGYYNVAYNLTFSLQTLVSGFIATLMPSLSRHHRDHPADTAQFYLRAMRYLWLIGLPIAVGVSFLADRLILLMYGAAYAPAGPVLRILIWVLPVLMITSLYGSLVIVVHRERAMARVNGVNAGCNLLVNAWLIPHYGMLGAAAMTAITEVVGLVQYLILLRDILSPRAMFVTLRAPLVATAVMAGGLVAAWTWPLIVLIPCCAGIYAAVLLLTGGIEIAELRGLAGIIGLSALRRHAKSIGSVANEREGAQP